MTDGCDSIGAPFNPTVTASGYGYDQDEKAPGLLGPIKNSYNGDASIEVEGDFDLSGNHDVTGRAMSINYKDYDGKNVVVACCTIGISGGKKPVYNDRHDSYGHDSYGSEYLGHGSYYQAPKPKRSYKPAYKPAGYGYAAPRNNYW